MELCPQCGGKGGGYYTSDNGKQKKIDCSMCKGKGFVTDEVPDNYGSPVSKISDYTYSSEEEKRELGDKLIRENIEKSIEFDIKNRARNLGFKI